MLLSWLPCFSSEHLQNVMGQTNQQPFSLHLRQTAQEKLTHAAHVFEISKNRFHNGLALIVDGRSGFTLQLVPHAFLHASSRAQRQWPFGCAFIRWHIHVYRLQSFLGYRRGAEVTRISRNSLWQT